MQSWIWIVVSLVLLSFATRAEFQPFKRTKAVLAPVPEFVAHHLR